jgi:hypothetical protein
MNARARRGMKGNEKPARKIEVRKCKVMCAFLRQS